MLLLNSKFKKKIVRISASAVREFSVIKCKEVSAKFEIKLHFTICIQNEILSAIMQEIQFTIPSTTKLQIYGI
jgi:hypothetical protein